jgi:undecaprenyl phosphate N,N'-diacetylbacillosamine 1-phosphate transferase
MVAPTREFLKVNHNTLYTNVVKPFFDRVFAAIALVVCSPVLLVTIFLLLIFNKGKVWFLQPRPGKDKRIFNVIKFKTMTDDRDASGQLLPDDVRLTPVGKFIRKTSIDELPQLINVVRGEMSFIGPRPLLVEYLNLYSEEQHRRHLVKPGITGWAQVNGRNTISWQQKFKYDVWYVENISFLLDIKILFLTLLKVFMAEGISGEGSATMKRFSGNN